LGYTAAAQVSGDRAGSVVIRRIGMLIEQYMKVVHDSPGGAEPGTGMQSCSMKACCGVRLLPFAIPSTVVISRPSYRWRATGRKVSPVCQPPRCMPLRSHVADPLVPVSARSCRSARAAQKCRSSTRMGWSAPLIVSNGNARNRKGGDIKVSTAGRIRPESSDAGGCLAGKAEREYVSPLEVP